ncbi:MAG: hypothetical protein ACOX51_07385 [Myxococcota bacterium]|jgi:hypothetical protein|nr:hypothetical protein [Myxococcota bacterium]OQC38958.1 MAG: hypothetical protein BWX66_01143 [Deltaproteobacteria bacterium ADurb.Bin058]MBP8970220.1 hypothetical protein [Myxococcota bacterium]HOE82422.1 hypothetical protein [Myxococcota bacterium]HON25307.1 hypothetical protein [Myxococcota bacterium]
MRSVLIKLIAGLFAILLALPALAESEPGGAGEPNVKQMDFEGDVLEGEIMRPNQGIAEALLIDKDASLIKVRKDFVDEILKSAEDL